MELLPVTAASNEAALLALQEAYPFVQAQVIGSSTLGKPIWSITVGNGPRKVLFTAAHHANEWLTALILQRFARELAQAIAQDTELSGVSARALSEAVTVHMVPLVNPDGADLLNGALSDGQVEAARKLAEQYPAIPFPDGWKADIAGVDLNLQYPAGWLQARQIKFSQGFTRPGPRDYVGRAPLTQPEAAALAAYTVEVDPALVLAFHSQGQVIYWQFDGIEVPGARELGEALAAASGYLLDDTPYESSFAGYKDWFIKYFRRPGYTVEVGLGENPLPLEQFPRIYAENLGLLITAALGTEA